MPSECHTLTLTSNTCSTLSSRAATPALPPSTPTSPKTPPYTPAAKLPPPIRPRLVIPVPRGRPDSYYNARRVSAGQHLSLFRMCFRRPSASGPYQRLTLEPAVRDRATAHRQRQVRGLAAQHGTRAVRPVQVAGPQLAVLDLHAETGMAAAPGQVIKYHPDALIGAAPRHAQRHGHVQAVDHHVVEGTVIAAARWGPVLHHLRTQAGGKLARRQPRVTAGHLVRQPGEVEAT